MIDVHEWVKALLADMRQRGAAGVLAVLMTEKQLTEFRARPFREWGTLGFDQWHDSRNGRAYYTVLGVPIYTCSRHIGRPVFAVGYP